MVDKLPVYWGEEPGRRFVGVATIRSSHDATIHIMDPDLIYWLSLECPCSISIGPTQNEQPPRKGKRVSKIRGGS